MLLSEDPNCPSNLDDLRRYLGNQFVETSQNMGIFVGDDEWDELLQQFHRERDQIIAEARQDEEEQTHDEPQAE